MAVIDGVKRFLGKMHFFKLMPKKHIEMQKRTLEEAQYQNLLNTHRTLMGWRHDYQNHLSVIKEMLAIVIYKLQKRMMDDLTQEAIEK